MADRDEGQHSDGVLRRAPLMHRAEGHAIPLPAPRHKSVPEKWVEQDVQLMHWHWFTAEMYLQRWYWVLEKDVPVEQRWRDLEEFRRLLHQHPTSTTPKVGETPLLTDVDVTPFGVDGAAFRSFEQWKELLPSLFTVQTPAEPGALVATSDRRARHQRQLQVDGLVASVLHRRMLGIVLRILATTVAAFESALQGLLTLNTESRKQDAVSLLTSGAANESKGAARVCGAMQTDRRMRQLREWTRCVRSSLLHHHRVVSRDDKSAPSSAHALGWITSGLFRRNVLLGRLRRYGGQK